MNLEHVTKELRPCLQHLEGVEARRTVEGRSGGAAMTPSTFALSAANSSSMATFLAARNSVFWWAGLSPPPPLLGETEVSAARDDDVITSCDADEFRGGAEPLGEVVVLRTRRGIAARMVVNEHDAVRRLADDGPEHVAR
jgi:hypothetical protein